MSIPVAYFGLILIWSTTPLAIQWSSQGAGFALAVLLRMLLGLTVAGRCCAGLRIGLPLHARHQRAYLVGGSALSVRCGADLLGLALSALRAGVGAVGLSPLMTGVLARAVAGRAQFTLANRRHFARRARAGADFPAGDSLGAHALAGLLALLGAVSIHTVVIIRLKLIGDDDPPLATTVGSLCVAVPLFALLWLIDDGVLPAALPSRTGWAIAYLGVFRLGGRVCAVLLHHRHLNAARVSLIALFTPVLAAAGPSAAMAKSSRRGCGCAATILGGLALHQWEALHLLLQGWSRWHRLMRLVMTTPIERWALFCPMTVAACACRLRLYDRKSLNWRAKSLRSAILFVATIRQYSVAVGTAHNKNTDGEGMWQFVWERQQCLTGLHKWSYLAIPAGRCVIGWFTNWKAIKLTFYPKEILGHCAVSRLAGIVPRKAEKWPAWPST